MSDSELPAHQQDEGELRSLPDPAKPGPYRPFASDPKWDEAWWWLGLPILFALLAAVAFWSSRVWSKNWVNGEHGIVEVTHFILPLMGLVIGLRLLFSPFVRRRPLVLVVTILSVLACLYVAGEEISWGQHFFYWETPEGWQELNRQDETNLHNVSNYFGEGPRTLMEYSIVIGGLLVPLTAAFASNVRANRFSLFLPAAALMPTAIGAIAFSFVHRWSHGQHKKNEFDCVEFSETYIYFFMFAYLLIFARRLRELGGPPLISRSVWMTSYVAIALLFLAFEIWIRWILR